VTYHINAAGACDQMISRRHWEQWIVEGFRRRCRPRICWFDNILAWTG